MRLASTATLRDALRYEEAQLGDNAFAAALSWATEKLSGDLRTRFDRQTVTETFYVRPVGGVAYGTLSDPKLQLKLALKNGFLTGAPTITYAADLSLLATEPVALDATAFLCDLEKGSVTYFGADLRGQLIRVSYTAGFAVDPDDDELFTVPTAQSWLVQAALAAATVRVFNTNPEMVVGAETGGSLLDLKVQDLIAQSLSLIDGKQRYFADALRAVA